jgi:hypothetical protein
MIDYPFAAMTHRAVDLQTPFDTAVVIPTIVRPSLERAIQAVWDQDLKGTIHIVVGIDKQLGDPQTLANIRRGPANCALTVLNLGYSTSARHGGLYPGFTGGALRTVLTYLANSRYVAYLDDDNRWAKGHLSSLLRAIQGYDFAYSRRWYVDPTTAEPLCVDDWESVGPDDGAYKDQFGGFIDPSCLMLDKLACDGILHLWSYPLEGDDARMSEDRSIFGQLRQHFRGNPTNLPTAYYTIRASDCMESKRRKWIAQRRAGKGAPRNTDDAPRNTDESAAAN